MFAGGGQFGGGCAQPAGRAPHRHAADAGKNVDADPKGRQSMIAQDFEYQAPTSLKEALGLLAQEDTKVLAGGMSLIPLMKLRLALPGQLVDIGRIAGLNFIHQEGGTLRIGATTTHYQVESSPLIRSRCPLLAEAAAHIGDIQVRNVGTIGGSIAHADPAADYPASLLALEARVSLFSSKGKR